MSEFSNPEQAAGASKLADSGQSDGANGTADPGRPAMSPDLSGDELRRWYWVRQELADLARQLGIAATGGKQELTERIAAALDGKPIPKPARRAAVRAQLVGSLTLETVIPEGQRSSQLLRAFFQEHIGARFHFDHAMRQFIAEGAGKTLADAIAHWHATRSNPAPPIGAQFEYNRFIREWHLANPGSSREDAIAAWREKRSRPRDSIDSPS